MTNKPDDWGKGTDSARETSGIWWETPFSEKGQTTEAKPDLTAEDLALLDGQAPRESDDDVLDTARRLLAQGHFTVDELRKNYSLSDDEAAAIQAPKQIINLASVEAQLAEIDKTRRADSQAYWKDEGMQKRELELLRQQERLKSGQAPATAEQPADLATDNPGIAPELLKQWEKEGGAETRLQIAQTAVEAILGSLESEEQTALDQSFVALPDTIRNVAINHLSVAPGGSSRPASDAAVEEFCCNRTGQRSGEGMGIPCLSKARRGTVADVPDFEFDE